MIGDKRVRSMTGMFAIAGVVVLLTLFMFGINYVIAQPSGASVTEGTPERAPEDAAGSASAYAGNITSLAINGFTNTRAWQGYYGNVTGTIQLADGSDNVFYNWSSFNPEGEVLASTNQTITWTSLQCFNFTANGTEGGVSGETVGGTNVGGLNLSGLEARYGIAFDDVDGVNETFGFDITHDQFFIGALEFSAGECLSTASFDSTGDSVDNNFEEVLMYEPNTRSVVYTAILEESSVTGFNNQDNDFQMMVLENGHGTDTTSTTYYFWVEIE